MAEVKQGAPFELVIGSIFIYQLLGWSGFAGFVILVIGAPLNSYLVRRGRDISKALLEARDKRMKVLNELITEAKFIKFGAGEDSELAVSTEIRLLICLIVGWIEKCLGARAGELRMLIQSSVIFLVLSLDD